MCEDFSFIDSAAFQSFLLENETADTTKLRLKHFPSLSFDQDLAITQIECRRKALKKIPELAGVLAYPTNVSIEQCSSEVLAKFHALLFAGSKSVIDLTCGLGIDTFYIAQQAASVTSIDASDIVASAANRNMRKLGQSNVDIICAHAEEFLANHPEENYSSAFVDPSRRTSSDRMTRTYAIKDTVPNLSSIISLIEHRCGFIVVKASPMVDISQTLSDFPDIAELWILSVKNECKELLFKIDFLNATDTPIVHCIDFSATGKCEFSYAYGYKHRQISDLRPLVDAYLFVPNASIMKAGAFDLVADHFSIHRVAVNSHIHISDNHINGYPGKSFVIDDIFSFSKPEIKRLKTKVSSANISCRNFPLKPDELRKRLKIADGGQQFLFATTLPDKSKILILCHPVNA